MTDNKAFVENVEHSCRESVLCAKNFALCWDAPDPGEQGVRLQFLRDCFPSGKNGYHSQRGKRSAGG